jgi:hypothetical protein
MTDKIPLPDKPEIGILRGCLFRVILSEVEESEAFPLRGRWHGEAVTDEVR